MSNFYEIVLKHYTYLRKMCLLESNFELNQIKTVNVEKSESKLFVATKNITFYEIATCKLRYFNVLGL